MIVIEPSIQGTSEYITDGEELHESVEECEGCPEKVDKVRISVQKWYELQYIKELQGQKEFAVFLLGKFNPDDGIPDVEDYYIPEQEVSAGSADITEEDIPIDISSRIIGHLHSHHNMGCNRSGIDVHHLNYPVHIIISNNGNSALIRKKTTCGKIIKSEAEIVIQYSVSGIQGLDKIKDRMYNWERPTKWKSEIPDYKKQRPSDKRHNLIDIQRCPSSDEETEDEWWGRMNKPGMY